MDRKTACQENRGGRNCCPFSGSGKGPDGAGAWTKQEAEGLNAGLQASRTASAGRSAAARRELSSDWLTVFTETIQSEAYRPCPTGLSFFDALLDGGIIQQSLLILTAAPGTGRTALCQQIAEAMAAHRRPVVCLNLEMSREQMFARAVSAMMVRTGRGRKTAMDILQGCRWTDGDRRLILEATEEYRRTVYPYIQYNPGGVGSSWEKIRDYLHSTGERSKAENRQAPALIVDCLHLVRTDGGLDNQELPRQVVKGLKDYAVRYNTFVIAISATNRVSNISGRITMESGRDSSNIEYTGDYQLSLNYSAVDSGEVKTTETEKMAWLQRMPWRQMVIRVLKGRFVMPGRSARVYFHAACNMFYGEDDRLPDDAERTSFSQQQTRAGNRRS